MTAITGTRVAPDGTKLATYRWPVDGSKATILVVHGIAEHLGRYERTAAQFNERGFEVRGTDLRGFGASGGERAYVQHFTDYVDDLSVDVAAARRESSPIVLLGLSMGGLIATLYAESSHPQPDWLVLSAPALNAAIPAAKQLLARALVKLVPRFRIANGLKGEQLSRNPAVGKAYFADSLVAPRSTVRLGIEFVDSMGPARSALSSIAIPTLVIHGSDDSLVLPAFSEPFASLPSATRVVFDGFRHESFNEDGGVRAIDTVSSWIEGQL